MFAYSFHSFVSSESPLVELLGTIALRVPNLG